MHDISLNELISLIQKSLKDNLDPSYWVIAEIGDINVNQKGHCYLELIETTDDKIIAKSRATIWSYTYSNLSTWFQGITGQPLSQGMKILANVKINFHEIFGFSLNIQDIDANYTLGEKERAKQEVINRLIADGVFDMNKELELPIVPQKVAVVSSPTAAGFGDFNEHILANQFNYKIDSKLFPAIMQGDEAPQSIIKSLHGILEEENYDIIVLVRGGGSQLDLECFNDYELCSHLAQIPIPVITGIGHDRDETIADMVVHTKQKTPTAVAEFILQGFTAYESQIEDKALEISRATGNLLQQASLQIETVESRIVLKLQNITTNEANKLNSINDKLRFKTDAILDKHSLKLESISKRHNDLDPKNVLKRGFTFTTRNRNSIFAKEVKKGDELLTYTRDQIIQSKVTKTDKNDKI